MTTALALPPSRRQPIELCSSETLEALSPHERCVAWVLAVHYVPMGKRELAGAVSDIDASGKCGGPLGVQGLTVPAQVELVSRALETLISRGIVVEHSSMWMCSWSAHPVICGSLRSSRHILSIVRDAVEETKPSIQYKSHHAFKEGIKRWQSLLDGSFIEEQRKGPRPRISTTNRLLEKLFSPEQLSCRWFGTAIEEHFNTLPSPLVTTILEEFVFEAIREQLPLRQWVDLMERFVRAHTRSLSPTERLVAGLSFQVAGYPHLTAEVIGTLDEESFERLSPFPSRLDLLVYQLNGTVQLLRGDYAKAAELFDVAFGMMKAVFGSKHFDADDFGFLHLIALFRQNTTKSLKQLHRMVCNGIPEGLLVETL